MRLRKLKWASVLLPIGFVAALVLLVLLTANSVANPVGYAVVVGAAAGPILLFSTLVFRRVEALDRETVDQNRRLDILVRISTASAESHALPDLLSSTLDRAMEITGANAGVVCLLEPESAELAAACYRGLSERLAQRVKRQKLADDPVGNEAVTSGKPVILDDMLADPETATYAREEGFRSAVSIPLKAEGEVRGILALVSQAPHDFPPPRVALLVGIAAQLGLLLKNAALLESTRQRNQELASFLALGRAASSSLEPSAVLNEALEAVRQATSADGAEVWLTSGPEELRLVRSLGIDEGDFAQGGVIRFGEGLPGAAARQRRTILTHQLAADPRLLRRALGEQFETYFAVPLVVGDELVGVLGVAARDSAALASPAERRLLEGIGEQVAIAVENARLHERVIDRAVIDERERIARELHDGLAQVLGYSNTQILAIKKHLSLDRHEEADRELNAMHDAVRLVYADVREAILGLSLAFATPGGLVPNLNAYLERFGQLSSLRTDVSVDADLIERELPAQIELQLMRIVQEALSNVRKHAAATSACVRLRQQGAGITVEVEDDGCGFDPEVRAKEARCFGMRSMRERAEAIHGNLRVDSAPGRGTTVTVHVPVKEDLGVRHASAVG